MSLAQPSLLFIDQSGQLGGAELCLADLAVFHRDEATVLLLSGGPFEQLLRNLNIPYAVHPLPGKLAAVTKETSLLGLLKCAPSFASYFAEMRRLISKHDVLYLNTPKALLFGTACSLFFRQRRIYHLHDILDRSHFSATNIRLLVAAANRMDAVIANSEATAEAFRKAGGRVKTVVIPNGFEPSCFGTATDHDLKSLRQQFSSGENVVVAMFGRLARWKGQHLLIEAASRIKHLTVWIVGEALFTKDDRDYAEELHQQAERCDGRVHFLGFRSDVPALMQAADIVVNASVSPEPFGRVVVEGMFSGKPVIAPNAGGPKEIVQDGVTGLLFETGSVDSLEEKLMKLVDSDSLRQEMGQNGRRLALEKYTLSVIQAQTVSVLAAPRH